MFKKHHIQLTSERVVLETIGIADPSNESAPKDREVRFIEIRNLGDEPFVPSPHRITGRA